MELGDFPDNIAKVNGELEGAKFTLAVPQQWNNSLLIHCHGCVPEGIALTSDVKLSDFCYSKLLESGWIIGMTSYRKEGLIVKDAILDIENLIVHVKKTYGTPQIVLLEGESMGGAIVTFIGEHQVVNKPICDGIIAVGAALLVKEHIKFEYTPKIPFIYITNTDETTLIDEYIKVSKKKLEEKKDSQLIVPSNWIVRRKGHANVSGKERYSAVESMLAHLRKKVEIPAFYDCTIDIVLTSKVFFDDAGIWGKILDVDMWGDLYTDITPQDMAKIGINPGMKFICQLGGKRFHTPGKEFKITFAANSFVSVNQGEWLVYDHAEGNIVISANGYAIKSKANEKANVKGGDIVFIEKPVGVGAPLLGIPGPLEDKVKQLQLKMNANK